MPNKPRPQCAVTGCPEKADAGSVYCTRHKKEKAKKYEMYDRSPETAKRYNGVWRKIRASYIKAHPLCEDCLGNGKLTPAEHVHHKKPLSEGGTNDVSNLRGLCKECHSRTHAMMRNL